MGGGKVGGRFIRGLERDREGGEERRGEERGKYGKKYIWALVGMMGKWVVGMEMIDKRINVPF